MQLYRDRGSAIFSHRKANEKRKKKMLKSHPGKHDLKNKNETSNFRNLQSDDTNFNNTQKLIQSPVLLPKLPHVKFTINQRSFTFQETHINNIITGRKIYQTTKKFNSWRPCITKISKLESSEAATEVPILVISPDLVRIKLAGRSYSLYQHELNQCTVPSIKGGSYVFYVA